MNTDNVTAGLLSIIFVLTTQIIKKAKPEKFEEYSKYVTFALIVLGAILSLVYFFSASTPVVATNDWEMIKIVINQLILGALAGASASGFYEVAHNTPALTSEFKSVYAILGEREPKEG